MINLCFMDSSQGCLKYAFKDEKVACLPLLVFWGNISNVLNVESREEIYRKFDNNYFNIVKFHINDFIKLVKNDQDIRIWYHSGNSLEFCGLLHAVSLLINYNIRIVDCNRIIKSKNITAKFRHTGEIGPVLLKELLIYEHNLTNEEIVMYTKQWKTLLVENAPLRVINNGYVISTKLDFYDEIIKKYLPQETTNVINIIGDIIGHENIFYDYFIADRINYFISKGILLIVDKRENIYKSSIKLQKL